MSKIKMSKVFVFVAVLFVAGLVSLQVSAACPKRCPEVAPTKCNTGCKEVVQKKDDCGCPKKVSSCGGCGSAPKSEVTMRHTGYTAEPAPEQYQMSARSKMFTEEAVAAEPERRFFMGSILGGDAPCERCDKNGSIFGGGPCENCDKNGSIFGGGPCENCDNNGSIFGGAPCDGEDCAVAEVKKYEPKPNPRYLQDYVVFDDDLYKSVHKECSVLAPLELGWVDFRLQNGMSPSRYSRKVGNYRFRIFGCRRDTKNAILNEGRILEKDMRFIEIFDDMVNDCYNVVKTDQCIMEDTKIPEYVLTAEITDVFMNVCDGFDWDETQKTGERQGSSEMTVVWRLLNASKTNVIWKGKSVGYGELMDGEPNGELMLIERAFADAVENLRAQPDFEEQLAVRINPEEMSRQRMALMDMQRLTNPGICQYPEYVGTVVENSGSNSAGHAVVENSGAVSSGYGTTEGWISVPQVGVVTEASGVTTAGSGATEGWISVPQVGVVTEASGITTAGYGADGEGLVVEMVEVEAVDPQPAVMTAMFEQDRLCIIERPEYENMAPENVYKVRASIVDVENAFGKRGAGLLLSENFVMTSAELIDRRQNLYNLKTINGNKFTARAFRVNPSKNTALLVLDKATEFTPLSLGLVLPPVGKGQLMTLGMFDLEEDGGEGYLENSGVVSGYRYSEDGTAEIVIDTFVQSVTIGGALIDEHGRITGISHSSRQAQNDPDLFLPMETAMKSLGIEICGKAFPVQEPRPAKSWRKPIADLIEGKTTAPAVMPVQERK